MVLVDGFEDGDASEWSNDMTAQTGTVLSGSYSGELASSAAFKSSKRSHPETTGAVSFLVRVDGQSGNENDSVRIEFFNGGDGWGGIWLDGAGNIEVQENYSIQDTGETWSTDTTYQFKLVPDFANDVYTVYLDGTELGTYEMRDGSATATTSVQVSNDTDDSGITRSAFVDDFEYTIRVPTLAIDAARETEVDLSWTDESVDGYNIYRAESSGSTTSDYTQIDSVSGGTTSYTDTGVVGGEQYYYRVTATENGNEGDISNEESTTTSLSAPSDLSVDAVNGDQFDVSWTDNSTGEDGFHIYVRHDGGAWTQDGSVAANTTTYTTSSLLDGEQYDIEVRAYTEHTESASGTVTATTELPDVTIDSLDNGIEDEITVNWTDVIDNGSYRVQYKESTASSWTDWGTVDETTTSATITGLEDGEEYNVELRTETEHETGAWDSATITTEFPTPANLSVAGITKTSADVSWDDQADNEDGFRVYHAREYDYGWGPWQQVADLDANSGTGTVTYTDTELSPGNTYKWQIEAYTEDATATAETTSVTTTSSDRPRTQTGGRGWTVQVEHPSGRVLEPQLLDDPSFTPALNDYPRVEVPVPRDERWQRDAFEGAPLSVWKDGRILPIDTLVDVRLEEGRAVLVGRGGSELQDRVQAEYDNTEAHVAAEELITSETSYTANVDDPASSTESNTEMQSADTDSELREALNSALDETTPVEIADGKHRIQQTCFLSEAEDSDRENDPFYITDNPEFSSGEGQGVYNSASNNEWDFTPQHTIPSESVGVWMRMGDFDDCAACEWILEVNGTEYKLDELSGGEGILRDWVDFANNGYNGPGYDGPDLAAGETVTVKFRGTTDDGGYTGADVVALVDNRYNYTFDNDNGGNSGYLDGPQLYPDAVDVVFDDNSSAFNVVAGRIEAILDDTSNQQAVALSNDQGASYQTASNTDTFETSFDSAGSTIRWRLTLSRYGSQTDATPKTGIYGQSLDAFTLYADLEDSPVLDEQAYDGALVDVLNQIADYGNFIWELQRSHADGWSVEWTQPGQRTATSDDSIAQYSVSKSTANTYERAVIKGQAQPVRGEQFTSNVDSWVALDHAHLVSSTQIVRDPSTGETFELGTDYELDRSAGEIKVLSGGSMSDGTTYEIDYQYKTQGSYTAADAGSDPDTIVRTIPSIASNRGCEQAALYLIQRIQNPLWEAEVTVPTAQAGRSLVDDLLLEDVPTQGNHLEVREIEQTPMEVVLRLGSRQSVGEVINDIQSRLSSVSERV